MYLCPYLDLPKADVGRRRRNRLVINPYEQSDCSFQGHVASFGPRALCIKTASQTDESW